MNKYSYSLEWSQEDQEYIGLCKEFPSLSILDKDPIIALKGIIDLVAFINDPSKNS